MSPARAAAFAILRRLQRTKGHVDLSFEGAPELRQLSGLGLAQLSGYFWAPAVA